MSDAQLEVANRVLATFAPESRIARRHGRWYVFWKLGDGKETWRRWSTRGQDFYPVWSRRWPHGGTACTALSQLIRWLQGKPVLPISTWRYWGMPAINLVRGDAVQTLLDGGYPEHADCVLCHQRIDGGIDWWHLGNVSGPCCGWTTGCRQQPVK